MRQPGGDRGAAAVEFALVAPLFLLLVFGIVDFSRAFSLQLQVLDAAAEGTRTLATGGTIQMARSAVSSLLEETAESPEDDPYPGPEDISYPGTTLSCPATATPGSTQASMTVAVTNFKFVAPLIGELFPGGLTISGTAARQCAN